jgi:hypothetical protein
MSCPIKVDNGDQPSETVYESEETLDEVPLPTGTPSTRLASVSDRFCTEARRFGAMASL